MVQAWYQGGISVFDFTDSAQPEGDRVLRPRADQRRPRSRPGGFWSTYWYNGDIYGNEIARGFDTFGLTPTADLSANEIAAAASRSSRSSTPSCSRGSRGRRASRSCARTATRLVRARARRRDAGPDQQVRRPGREVRPGHQQSAAAAQLHALANQLQGLPVRRPAGLARGSVRLDEAPQGEGQARLARRLRARTRRVGRRDRRYLRSEAESGAGPGGGVGRARIENHREGRRKAPLAVDGVPACLPFGVAERLYVRSMFLRALTALTIVATGLATGGAQARVPSGSARRDVDLRRRQPPRRLGRDDGIGGRRDRDRRLRRRRLASRSGRRRRCRVRLRRRGPRGLGRNGHGTATAGIAAGRADNGLGAAGVCWRCRIMPLRVIGPDGFARWIRIANAIDYAVEHGAAVVNASIYGESIDPVVQYAIRRARAAGVLVVAAAGNEGRTLPEYPAAFPETVSVAATTEQNQLASYSSRGDWVKLAAPACMPTSQIGGGFGPGVVPRARRRSSRESSAFSVRGRRLPPQPSSRTRCSGRRDPSPARSSGSSTRPRRWSRSANRCRTSSRRSWGGRRRPDAARLLGRVGRCGARDRLPLAALP